MFWHSVCQCQISTLESNKVSLSTKKAEIRTATVKSNLVEAEVVAVRAELASLREEVTTLSRSHKSLKDTVNTESNRLDSLAEDKNLPHTPNSNDIC